MQSRPTFSPFEVEEKLLRDSPLEETLQYGEHQQTRVHTKVRNMVNPTEAPLHNHMSLLFLKLRQCCGSALMPSHHRAQLLFQARQKCSESRTANKNSHINASNNAPVYGRTECCIKPAHSSCSSLIAAILSLTKSQKPSIFGRRI